MINYLTGDATKPVGDGAKIVAHVVNDRGGFGAGFAKAVAKCWPAAKVVYKAWFDTSPKLGDTLTVDVAADTAVMQMLAQHGYISDYDLASDGEIPLRYDALKNCLETVAKRAKERGASVHMPRIGCGLAGGKWDVVGPMIEKALDGIDVYIYDYGN